MQDKWRTYYALNARLSSFKRSIEKHRDVLRRFKDSCERPYFSFSGGKDSSAMLVLAAELGMTDIPVFTQGDNLDWDYKKELCYSIIQQLGFTDYSYIESTHSVLYDLSISVEEISMQKCWDDLVADFVKSRNRDGFAMGIRQQESLGRNYTLKKAYKNGLVQKCADGLIHAYPVAFLKGEDIFSIIVTSGIPYAEIYDRSDDDPPHKMRFSWMFKPGITQSTGGIGWLKNYYPEQYRKLTIINPLISL